MILAPLLCPPAWASEDPEIRSIKADFIQEKELKILKNPLVSRGLFLYGAPDSIRWEYFAPTKSVVLFHRGKGRRFTWNREEWVEDPGFRPEVMELVCGEMRNWLSGGAKESDRFKAETMATDPAVVRLTPLDEGLSAFIKTIIVKHADRRGIIREIEIIESSEATTRFIFNQVKINGPLPEGAFEAP